MIVVVLAMALLTHRAGAAEDGGTAEPDELLAQSIRITEGDVPAALRLGWDVLSSGWRDRENLSGALRNEFPRTRRLGHLPSADGDLFASWYHFWGVMTLGYLEA